MLHVRLDFVVTNSPLLPSKSTICLRNNPKCLQMAQNVRSLCQIAAKPSMGHILSYVAQIQNPRAPSPPATPPTFCSFQASNCPTQRREPRTIGHWIEPE